MREYGYRMSIERKNFVGLLVPEAAQPNGSIATGLIEHSEGLTVVHGRMIRRIEGNRQALMPYVAFLAIIPLGFVLYRRNL